MIILSLRPIYFDFIKSGKKTIEGRINSDKFKDLKIGDKLIFTTDHTSEQLICVVKDFKTYPDFHSMLESEGIQNCLPGITDLQEAVNIYENLPGYKEKVKQFGALAIRIECI